VSSGRVFAPRTLQFLLFAFLLGAGFLLLLLHAPRADALTLDARPIAPSAVQVPVALPGAVTAEVNAPAPPVAPVSPRSEAQHLPRIEIAVTAPRAAGAAVRDIGLTRPHAASPAVDLSRPLPTDAAAPPPAPLPAARAESVPLRAQAASWSAPHRRDGESSPSTPPTPSTPAPPIAPATPTAPSASVVRGGHDSPQPTAFLAAAVALLVLLPVGTARARRLRLPQFAFTPLARPG
jgi:hypothetical protein